MTSRCYRFFKHPLYILQEPTPLFVSVFLFYPHRVSENDVQLEIQ